MDDVSNPSPKPASEKQVKANRRNASKSTGPRTERGKSWSRLNALKHGILASQAVITTTEGRAAREAFEAMVVGFMLDFRPVGAFEQALVQQIAACVWRQRRLLMFENRAGFQARDHRTFRTMNEPSHAMPPLYLIEGRRFEGDDVLDSAGLGLDLPSERDTTQLVRYESAVSRSLRNAIAQLRQHQQLRRDGLVGTPPDAAVSGEGSASAQNDQDLDQDLAQEAVQEVVVDRRAIKRNQGPEASRVAAKVAQIVYGREMELEEEARREEAPAGEEERAATEEGANEGSASTSENYQTKPNSLDDERILRKQQDIQEAADAVLRLGAGLVPKRSPSSD
jgi:hypothetical protein